MYGNFCIVSINVVFCRLLNNMFSMVIFICFSLFYIYIYIIFFGGGGGSKKLIVLYQIWFLPSQFLSFLLHNLYIKLMLPQSNIIEKKHTNMEPH